MSANLVELVLMIGGGVLCFAGSIKRSPNKMLCGSALCLISMAFLNISH